MAQYFKNVQSFEDLKNQFKTLARKNHPDAGGDSEIMKAINCEYDALFPIWKSRYNATVSQGANTTETAYSTRSEFYTQNGWKGENYDNNQSLKEIAAIIRAYIKELYPIYKFSVRTKYASMCQELYVKLKEAPKPIYKDFSDLTDKDIDDVTHKLIVNRYLDTANGWYKSDVEKQYDERDDFYKVYTDEVAKMLKDIDRQVESYNYDDCDSMIDYFHVKFYYFDCKPEDLKIVPKTARIKNKNTSLLEKSKNKSESNFETIENKSSYTYNITKGEDSRDGSELWLVRISEKLERDAYITENKEMKDRGGYYSKFRKAFIFRFDPTEILNGGKAA